MPVEEILVHIAGPCTKQDDDRYKQLAQAYNAFEARERVELHDANLIQHQEQMTTTSQHGSRENEPPPDMPRTSSTVISMVPETTFSKQQALAAASNPAHKKLKKPAPPDFSFRADHFINDTPLAAAALESSLFTSSLAMQQEWEQDAQAQGHDEVSSPSPTRRQQSRSQLEEVPHSSPPGAAAAVKHTSDPKKQQRSTSLESPDQAVESVDAEDEQQLPQSSNLLPGEQPPASAKASRSPPDEVPPASSNPRSEERPHQPRLIASDEQPPNSSNGLPPPQHEPPTIDPPRSSPPDQIPLSSPKLPLLIPSSSAPSAPPSSLSLTSLPQQIYPPHPIINCAGRWSDHTHSYLTPALSELTTFLAPAQYFDAKATIHHAPRTSIDERGEWRFCIDGWDEQLVNEMWVFLRDFVVGSGKEGGGKAGWAVSLWAELAEEKDLSLNVGLDDLVEEEEVGSRKRVVVGESRIVRFFCQAEVLVHVWLLLYAGSYSRVTKAGAQWIGLVAGGDREEVVCVQMPWG